jgi:hypothetical protein
MCSGGIDILRLVRDMVKLNGGRVRWKDPLLLNGNSRHCAVQNNARNSGGDIPE